MPAPQTTWSNLKEHIAERVRESELFDGADYETDNPFWLGEDPDGHGADVEHLLLEASQDALRALPQQAYNAIGSAAVTQAAYFNGGTLALNTIGVLGASIQIAGIADPMPAVRVTPREWYHLYEVPATSMARYCFMQGKVFFKGQTINLMLLTEPPLATWQGDDPILPPSGFDEPRVEWVRKILQTIDYSPEGET